MVAQGVSIEWCEYAIARLEPPVSGIVCRAMAVAYTWSEEKWFYWMQCAADSGDLIAMKIVREAVELKKMKKVDFHILR